MLASKDRSSVIINLQLYTDMTDRKFGFFFLALGILAFVLGVLLLIEVIRMTKIIKFAMFYINFAIFLFGIACFAISYKTLTEH